MRPTTVHKIGVHTTHLGISIVLTEVERRKGEEKVNGSLLLRFPRAEKMMGRCTKIKILYILINVTKYEECYSAINRLPKLIIEKDVFLFSLFGRNCVFSYFIMLLFMIPANNRN